MYDAASGRCFDGIHGPDQINKNAGAESTIEALYALMEVERYPDARRWLFARADKPARCLKNGKPYLYRIFSTQHDSEPSRMGLVMDLDHEQLRFLEDESLDRFLAD